MYLSQLFLNPRNRQVQAELTRPYEMHRTLMRAFTDPALYRSRDSEDAANVLFRLDIDTRANILRLLVQSLALPDWSVFQPDYAMRVDGPKQLAPQVLTGQQLAFRLRANPTKRMGNSAQDKRTIGKRVGIYDEEEQIRWLQRKGEQHGFAIVRIQVSKDDVLSGKKQGHDMRWLSVQFDGVLRVTDPDKLRQAVECGIGSGKAFGFGLLSLAPLAA